MATTPEQFWKLYEHLPAELKETIFSQETADHIYDSCIKNGIAEENVSRVAGIVGDTLLGLTLPEDFQKTLEKEPGLKKDAATAISREITRFVFFPVKESLRQLHAITEVASPAAPQAKKATLAATPAQEAATPTPKKEDTYRESFEEKE